MCTILASLYHRPREKSNACSIRRGPARRHGGPGAGARRPGSAGPSPASPGRASLPADRAPPFASASQQSKALPHLFPVGQGLAPSFLCFFPQRPLFLWKNSRKNRTSHGWGPVALHRMGTVLVKTGPRRRIVAASCASLASPFGELSSAPLRLLSPKPGSRLWGPLSSPLYFRLRLDAFPKPISFSLAEKETVFECQRKRGPCPYRKVWGSGTAAVMLYATLGDHSRPRPSVGETGKSFGPTSTPPGLWTKQGVSA